jgi:ectoine hydroxylase-related dioxygenase (phytanoyl-CoA dioxygenase family)
MTKSIPTYGMRDRLQLKDQIDLHVQQIELAGYTILQNVSEHGEIADWRSRIDAIVLRQAAEAGGAEALRNIGEENTARAALAYDEAFLRLALNDSVLAVCERLLGGYYILNQQNVVVNPPAGKHHHQAAYHRDLPYQHFVSTRPLAISALFCADPFTEASGGTVVIPGSHKFEAFPSDEVVAHLERQIEAPAGAWLLFDAMLFHRTGINRSNAPRRAVNHVWSLPILKQQIDLPALLPKKLAKDARLARLLGYDSDPPKSVGDWLARRRAKYAG